MYRDKKASLWMFLIGLGSVTQIYLIGCIGISELCVFIMAPFMLAKDYSALKNNGYLLFLRLLAFSIIALIISSIYNKTHTAFLIKGIAVDYSIFAHVIVFHRLLCRNPTSLGWFMLGAALSGIISIYGFNPQSTLSESGMEFMGAADAEEIINGPLFWSRRVFEIGLIPIYMCYLNIPMAYVVVVPVVQAAVVLATTVSGRSATLITLLGVMLMIIGGKSRKRMMLVGRYSILLLLTLCLVVFIYKSLYVYAATHGMLSDEQTSKYERQTNGRTDIVSMIVSGRIEPFVGLKAAIDAPFIGHGALPIDDKGYYQSFLEEYGSQEDIERYYAFLRYRASELAFLMIPTHSHIVYGWVSRGVVGLLFWLYVLYLMCNHVRKNMSAIPQLYGYFSVMLASYAWHIFFSPMGVRSTFALFIAAILLAKAVAEGRFFLPVYIEREINKHE